MPRTPWLGDGETGEAEGEADSSAAAGLGLGLRLGLGEADAGEGLADGDPAAGPPRRPLRTAPPQPRQPGPQTQTPSVSPHFPPVEAILVQFKPI